MISDLTEGTGRFNVAQGGVATVQGVGAAISGLVHLDEANRDGRFPVRIDAGIALHHGEAAYGNVGSGVRLDFTVIGPDVNLASRIATMNKVLGEPLLMSRAFADHLWGDPEAIGDYGLDGILEPVTIFRLKPPAAPTVPHRVETETARAKSRRSRAPIAAPTRVSPACATPSSR